MYTFNSRIRYSETDENGRLSPLGIINYFQDCSTFQSESLGMGIRWYAEQGCAWFLNSWRILIGRYPVQGDTVTIGTYAHGFQGIYGYRHFFMQDEKGSFAVRADSIWILCDTEKGTLLKPPKIHSEPYMASNEGKELPDLHMGEMKRKIRLPKELVPLGSLEVQRHHLDTNHHMNNAQYVDVALDAAGIRYPAELQAEYRHQAVLGDLLELQAGRDEAGGQVIALCDTGGTPYAVVRAAGERDVTE